MIKNLKTFRLKLKLNQAEFWKPVGVTQSCGSRYESGQHKTPMPIRLLLELNYGNVAVENLRNGKLLSALRKGTK